LCEFRKLKVEKRLISEISSFFVGGKDGNFSLFIFAFFVLFSFGPSLLPPCFSLRRSLFSASLSLSLSFSLSHSVFACISVSLSISLSPFCATETKKAKIVDEISLFLSTFLKQKTLKITEVASWTKMRKIIEKENNFEIRALFLLSLLWRNMNEEFKCLCKENDVIIVIVVVIVPSFYYCCYCCCYLYYCWYYYYCCYTHTLSLFSLSLAHTLSRSSLSLSFSLS